MTSTSARAWPGAIRPLQVLLQRDERADLLAGSVEAEFESVGVQHVRKLLEAPPLLPIVASEAADVGTRARRLRLEVADQQRPVLHAEVRSAHRTHVWLTEQVDAWPIESSGQADDKLRDQVGEQRLGAFVPAARVARPEPPEVLLYA